MAEITNLTPTKTGKKVNVYLDGSFAFTLNSEVAVLQGIHAGDILSESQVKSLQQADVFHNCTNAALRFLQYRPRSELEIKRRLRTRNYSATTVGKVLAALKQQGYIDDAAFARYWAENRVAFSPRSRRLVRQELMQKGVESEIIDCALDDLDDSDNAYRSGMKKAARIISVDYEEFKHRMYDYLRAQGFNHDTILYAIERLWQQRSESTG